MTVGYAPRDPYTLGMSSISMYHIKGKTMLVVFINFLFPKMIDNLNSKYFQEGKIFKKPQLEMRLML